MKGRILLPTIFHSKSYIMSRLTIYQTVKDILEENPLAREKKGKWIVLDKFYPKFYSDWRKDIMQQKAFQFQHSVCNNVIINPESIFREWRQVQLDHVHLQGEDYGERKKEKKEVRFE